MLVVDSLPPLQLLRNTFSVPTLLIFIVVVQKRVAMRIFVTNLNIRTTANHLMALFVRYGEVKSLKIIRDMDLKRFTGAALIEMEYNNGMMAISELNNLNFMNHYIELEEV